MIYLDNNATTLVDPSVADFFKELIASPLGNPGSTHKLGRRAKELLICATHEIASFFKVSPQEIVITSGATEALNTLIESIHGGILTSKLEHLAVLQPLEKKKGVTYLTSNQGAISVAKLQESLQADTRCIVLTACNNETGILTEIDAIATFAKERGIIFIVDGVALLGKEKFSLPEGVSAAVFSGHKIHAPLGIGIAVVKKGFPFVPQILGGGQQSGKRAGSENVALTATLAFALSKLQNIESIASYIRHLRDLFEETLLSNLSDLTIHGRNEKRVSNTSSICFEGVDAELLLMHLDLLGVCASYGSACSAGGLSSSRVLLNMGCSEKEARSTLRFSLSRFTTKEEILQACEIIVSTVTRLRALVTF